MNGSYVVLFAIYLAGEGDDLYPPGRVKVAFGCEPCSFSRMLQSNPPNRQIDRSILVWNINFRYRAVSCDTVYTVWNELRVPGIFADNTSLVGGA